MKKLLITLSIGAFASLAIAEPTDVPSSVDRFRIDNKQDVSFTDPSSWNEYDANTSGSGDADWQPCTLEENPWELALAADKRLRLKFDSSTVNLTSALGTAANPLNVSINGLWSSVFNISADFHITGNFHQDGGSTINIFGGAKVTAARSEGLDKFDIYGANTTVVFKPTENDVVSAGKDFIIRDGAIVTVMSANNEKLQAHGSDSKITINNATFNGGLEAGNGGTIEVKNNAILNVGRKNELITSSGGIVNFSMSASTLNLYYTGYDPLDTNANWRGNVMFIGLGGGVQQQTYTFKDGSIINGGGSADGIGFWNMDASTRQRGDITNGGNVNMGWNAFDNAESYMTINLESGTKFAANNIEMGNNETANSTVGKLTWNQSGTNLTDGYTEVFLKESFNARGSTAAAASFASEVNMQGFTRLEIWNLNLGQTAMQSGKATFNMTGEANHFVANAISNSNGSDRDSTMGGELLFYSKGDSAANKNTITITSSELVMQGSTTAGSTFKNTMTLAGNTVLRGADNKGVWLKVHEWSGKNYTTETRFEVIGAGNDLLLSGLEIGKNTTDGGGKGIFYISGGGSKILIEDGGAGRNGFKLDDGGEIYYAIDDSGITAIENNAWNGSKFTGKLTVDFKDITLDDITDGRYVLYTTVDLMLTDRTSNWFTLDGDGNVIAIDEDFVNVILKDSTDTYKFAIESRNDAVLGNVQDLVIYYTNYIPEPGTYAAIFGALALALAAYRRRK